jgi:hypothetical protein
MNEFEKLGKEILMHKYLYYVLGKSALSDCKYDQLEEKYIDMAKSIKEEPSVHIVAEWEELSIMDGFHASCLIGWPDTHVWANEAKEMGDAWDLKRI